MNKRVDRIAEMFSTTQTEGRPAVIGFVPGGWPERDATPAIVAAAIAGGADAMEIGLPFSDPMADGITNQRAYQQSLNNGFATSDLLTSVRHIRDNGVRVPLLIMGYFNSLLAYGASEFVQEAADAGVDGLILVDLPPEEAEEVASPARAAGLHLVYLLAPTSTEERISLVGEHASGFIYCVSVTGVTGARATLASGLPAFLERVRAHTDLPLAVGFGISDREQIRSVGQMADAAVVGSALVDRIANATTDDRSDAIRAYMEEITGRGTGEKAAP